MLFGILLSAELDAEGLYFVVVLCCCFLSLHEMLLMILNKYLFILFLQGYRTATCWRWCCPLCRCCWLSMALVPSFGAVGCQWRWCCRLVVLLVVLVVGAVSCWCCQLSVALFRCMVMAVGAVGFWWPWSCPFVGGAGCLGAGCSWHWCWLSIAGCLGAVGCWCC